MENKLLKELYDYFYVRPELDEQENEVEECHKALIEALAKPERKLVLRIIDAQNLIIEQTSLDSFTAGFELAWRLSIELQNYIPSRGKNKGTQTTLYYYNCELLSWLKDTTTLQSGMLTKSQRTCSDNRCLLVW